MSDDLPPNLSGGKGADSGPSQKDVRAGIRVKVRRAGVEVGVIGCGRVGRKIVGELALCGVRVHTWDAHIEDLEKIIHTQVEASSFIDAPEVVKSSLSNNVVIYEKMQSGLCSPLLLLLPHTTHSFTHSLGKQ